MSTLDTAKRRRKVACPTCGASIGKPCDGMGPLAVHRRRLKAYAAAFPTGRPMGSGTAERTASVSVRVPLAAKPRVKAWLPGAVRTFLATLTDGE